MTCKPANFVPSCWLLNLFTREVEREKDYYGDTSPNEAQGRFSCEPLTLFLGFLFLVRGVDALSAPTLPHRSLISNRAP